MKTKTSLSILFLMFTTLTYSQSELISFPYGSAVNIDGVISNNEWQDSDTIILGTGTQTTILFKHDSTSLLIAFVGNLQSASRFPEILFDINNDKSNNWMPDDWWFHVSAKDCDNQGKYGVYDSCAVVRSNWTAVSNMASGPPSPPFVDTIEVQIPFNTINLKLTTTNTFGICIMLTNTFTTWIHWPNNADRTEPSTWGSASFE